MGCHESLSREVATPTRNAAPVNRLGKGDSPRFAPRTSQKGDSPRRSLVGCEVYYLDGDVRPTAEC